MNGDGAEDIKYLKAQIEKYKEHELSTEIIRGCGRIMFEYLPEKSKEKLQEVIDDQNKAIEATLEEVKFNIYKKDYDKAIKLSEALID